MRVVTARKQKKEERKMTLPPSSSETGTETSRCELLHHANANELPPSNKRERIETATTFRRNTAIEYLKKISNRNLTQPSFYDKTKKWKQNVFPRFS